jgi:polyphosphate kinase
MYEDLGLLTKNPEITSDISNLFNDLSGFALKRDYGQLLVAPQTVRSGLITLIEREVEHHQAGRRAHIRLKLNSLVDEAMIDALYRASQAGVPVDLLVRGICALRPGVPGLSERITVRSILGRFLEHSRIFWFANGEQPQAWIGSADLMHRNLDRRVEVLVRVPTAQHVDELERLIEKGFAESTASWWLAADGTWTRHHLDESGEPLADLQTTLIRLHRPSRDSASASRR